jgi:hypothetical protein
LFVIRTKTAKNCRVFAPKRNWNHYTLSCSAAQAKRITVYNIYLSQSQNKFMMKFWVCP